MIAFQLWLDIKRECNRMIVENEFGLLEKMLGIEQLKFPSPALPTILG